MIFPYLKNIFNLLRIYKKYKYIIFLIFILAGCNISNPLQTNIHPDIIIKNFKISNYKNNTIEWTLKADEESTYLDEKRSIAKNVILEYFENGKSSVSARSEKAILYTDSNNIDLIGSILIESETGNKLFTEKISWNSKENILDTDDFFKIIHSNGDITTGDGLRAEYDLEKYEVKKNSYVESASIIKEFEKKEKKQE